MAELLDVVDAQNRVQYQEIREVIHRTGLLHRGIHVLVFNSKKELLLPLRSSGKDKFPNCFDTSVSEHCKVGENYEEAARRGLWEELGIQKPALKLLGISSIDCGPADRMISATFECRYNGKIQAKKSEIAAIETKTTGEIKKMLRATPKRFAPWTKVVLHRYFKTKKTSQIIR